MGILIPDLTSAGQLVSASCCSDHDDRTPDLSRPDANKRATWEEDSKKPRLILRASSPPSPMTLTTPRRTSIGTIRHPSDKPTIIVDLKPTSPQAGPSQAQLRHFRANDLQAVRDLFQAAIDTGKDSARLDALQRQRFDAINITFYSIIVIGSLAWSWAPAISITSSSSPSVNTLGGLLAILAATAFAYRRTKVSKVYNTFCNQSLASSDLRDVVGHYQLSPILRGDDVRDSEVKLGSDDVRGFWVVELDGKIVGCAGLDVRTDQPTHGELRRMVVSPNHRRYGIGKLLMNKIMDRAREYKLESVCLSTSMYQIPAQALYEKYGFVKERRWVMKEGFCSVFVLDYLCRL
ncbi:acyl-CoA N-acyltransferase [Pluteus cervinus]|uniref:Acyl-CoA N-acyltransferase n=1 Tax=Pluteus cervinus TaxID=181527 RepID=A0ACD3A724_9AGAR|nr:acyl-CoA N-acyltransferase [Pluteus cervinus]